MFLMRKGPSRSKPCNALMYRGHCSVSKHYLASDSMPNVPGRPEVRSFVRSGIWSFSCSGISPVFGRFSCRVSGRYIGYVVVWDLCVSGRLDIRKHNRLGIWVCRLGLRVCDRLGAWVFDCLGVRIFSRLSVRIFSCLDVWSFEYSVARSFGN